MLGCLISSFFPLNLPHLWASLETQPVTALRPCRRCFASKGTLLECHAGQTCDEAQCGHWERDNGPPPSDISAPLPPGKGEA